MKLSKVALSNAINCSPQKRKKNYQKMIKILHITRDTKQTLRRGLGGGREEKNVSEKLSKVTTTIKFFTFIYFLYMENDLFCSKI